MWPDPSEPGQEGPELDQAFYHRILRARDHAELFECRKIATRSRDERVLRALVAAMFASKAHRKAVSSCIRDYIGRRAVPALLWNLNRLPPDQRMFQARLLCLLGHWDAFAAYYRAMRESEPLDANRTKSVAWFLTNYTPTLLPGMRSALGSSDLRFFLFCAPYLYKYHPHEVSARLAQIARDPAAGLGTQRNAMHKLTAHAPERAVSCLLECGGGYPLETLLSTLSQLAASEEGKPLLPAVLAEFLRCDDERRVAATLFSPGHDEADRELQYQWITGRLKNWLDGSATGELPVWVRSVAVQLCRADNPKWLSYLESAARGGPLEEFARGVLFASGHPAGLRLLRQQIDAAARPEDLFRPCIVAINTYGKDALDVLDRVTATGHTKLRERIEQVVALRWPGKTINQLLDERKEANQPPVSADSVPPAEAPAARTARRKERIMSSFDRDRALADEVKELEQHCCQVCGRKLVNARTGDPYAETHHVHPLGHDGNDTMDNLLCLCPLCHALFHLGCVGIDGGFQIHASSAATKEAFLKHLRLAGGRRISRDALRYHWVTFFIPPEEARFEERDPEDD